MHSNSSTLYQQKCYGNRAKTGTQKSPVTTQSSHLWNNINTLCSSEKHKNLHKMMRPFYGISTHGLCSTQKLKLNHVQLARMCTNTQTIVSMKNKIYVQKLAWFYLFFYKPHLSKSLLHQESDQMQSSACKIYWGKRQN